MVVKALKSILFGAIWIIVVYMNHAIIINIMAVKVSKYVMSGIEKILMDLKILEHGHIVMDLMKIMK